MPRVRCSVCAGCRVLMMKQSHCYDIDLLGLWQSKNWLQSVHSHTVFFVSNRPKTFYSLSNMKLKRAWTATWNWKNVEDGRYDLYKFAKWRSVTVNGPILRQKSEQLAQQMGYDDFSATEGWFNRWKVWYGLEWLGKVQGESKEADGKATNAWTENNVAKLIEKYGLDQWFSTGVPRKTSVPWKIVRCSAGNLISLTSVPSNTGWKSLV